jgi:hypothetical protein
MISTLSADVMHPLHARQSSSVTLAVCSFSCFPVAADSSNTSPKALMTISVYAS